MSSIRFGGLGKALLVTLISALVTLGVMRLYTSNVLHGDLANHVLSARMFGVPDALKKHGFQVFYDTPGDTGWDGQFYYYIANDPLAHRDTAKHIDSDAYRYQRIGLPALAWFASRISLQDWVSPVTYYVTNLLIVLAATLVGGLFFARRGYGAWPILLWSLSLGVQLTLMNGLPDAAADGLLIISLTLHFTQRRFAYAVFATWAALSREAYILFPLVIALFDWANAVGIEQMRTVDAGSRRSLMRSTMAWVARRAWPFAIPALIFLAWQLYLRHKFHVAPSSQAHGILGLPFEAWFAYVALCLKGSHPLFGPGLATERELIALVLFMILLIICGVVAVLAWRRRSRDADPIAPIAASVMALVALYACFGKTVMEHYTGYMKAAGLFFLIVPFLWVRLAGATRVGLTVTLLIVDAYFGYYLWTERIDPDHSNYDAYVKGSQVTDKAPKACLKTYGARLALVGIEEINGDSLITRLSSSHANVFRVAVTNETSEPFTATTAAGSVNVSYHWLGADGATVVKDGIRSFLIGGLAPGATTNVPVVVEYPTQPGHYILRLTLVQEGCAWFYSADPSSKLDIDYVVR